jgi:hypothetical protein
MGALDEALVAAVTGLRDELRQQLLAEQPFADGVLLASALPAHTHAAADIVSGTLATARLGSGTANSGTFLHGDSTWGALVAGDIPNLGASIITSGTIATARLGSGSATSATYLHGDSTWAGIAAGDISSGTITPARLGSGASASTLLHGDSTFSAVSLTAEVTGTLPGVNGGTGVSNSGKTLTIGTSGTAVIGTGTSGDVGYWIGTNTMTADSGLTYDSAANALHVGGTTFAAGFQAGSTVWTLGSFTATPITNTGFVTVTVGGTSRRLMVG